MSGICGIVRLDGSDLTPAELRAMTKALERRGPDGTSQWIDGGVALGHTLLATTPEALIERLPLTDPGSGCTITPDVRLDNRDELIPALHLEGEERVIGDGELILRAYLKWGEDCPKHLLGDFAFAIWDPRSQQLFCARDHMGMRQLIYHSEAGRFFTFATEAETVLAHRAVPRRINDARIADFLDDLEGIDLTSTFFEEVYRLPPAHSLTVTKGGLSQGPYWALRPPPPLELPSDDAYAEAFLSVFTEAVRCRMRSAGLVGSMLSGGLDSGSVTAVAAKLMAAEARGPLPSFSAVGPDPESCIETRTIMAAAAIPGISPTFVSHAELVAYDDELWRLTQHSSEPFDGHMVLIRAIYLAAHKAGLNIVLDGVAGDVVLTAGNCTAEWLRRWHVPRALREVVGEHRYLGGGAPAWLKFIRSAWVAFVPLRLRRLRRRWMRRGAPHYWRAGIRIDPGFAVKSRLEDRRQQFWQRGRIVSESNRQHRAQAICHPNLVVGRERYERVASALAIEPRDPFMDLRVVQFCLSLPWTQLQAEGWPKLVLRRAMEKHLPPAVVWRRGKEHLGPAFIDELLRRKSGGKVELGAEITGIARVTGPSMVRLRNQATAKALDREARTALFYLLCWLRRCTSFANRR